MKSIIALGATLSCVACTVGTQLPSSAFDRGNGLQSWQHPGRAALVERCRTAPAPFAIGGGETTNPPPPPPTLPSTGGIPGVIADGQTWQVVWSWEGNNVDGPIASDNGTLLFANNDASNVMQFNPATGLASIIYDDVNTGGAVSRSKNGALFVASRGLNSAIIQLEPQRKVLANSYRGQPLDCIGGVLNDLTADSRGGVYMSISGGGLFYSDANGVVTQYGDEVMGPNGIILSPDERTLYVTNSGVVLAFDVESDGSLSNQRNFGQLSSGGGDGSAVDAQGRLYVATGSSADVFSPNGEFLGSIPGPQGMHGVAFGGRDKRTLFGIVFYGDWGTVNARNQIVAIPLLAQGYMGRAK